MKEIPGFNGKYLISRKGDVYSKHSKRLLKPHFVKTYRRVCLGDKMFLVHRLVAMTYLPNPDNLPEVNHKDFNCSNNVVENLEWCTRLGNMDHFHEANAHTRLLSKEQVLRIHRLKKEGLNLKQIAEALGCARHLVVDVHKGKTYKIYSTPYQ